VIQRAVDRFLEGQRWLEPLGDVLQRFAGTVYKGRAGHELKTLLNGTWLGHPLHPVLTDVPIGGWTLAVIFDVISLFSSASQWRAAANVAIAIGVLAALGSVVTGYTDWSDTIDRERRVGLTHGLLNTTATILYIVSLLIRIGNGGHVAAIVISWVGYAVLVTAAYLGGELVFGIGTGVNHHAWEAPITEWTPAIKASELPEATLLRVDVRGTPVLLYRKGASICAISNTCSHAGGPLNEGTLEGDMIICPWHSSRYDLCTGTVRGGPATMSAVRYDARIEDGQVEVRRSAATLQLN
jgi:nitrite reductase/ring-hydroxylating ferredoxin subunit/uncharacterized membrane protein